MEEVVKLLVVYMEKVVILFVTIIKLVSFAKPKKREICYDVNFQHF